MKIKDILDKADSLPCIRVHAGLPIGSVAEKLMETPQVREIYVVDKNGRLVGGVSPGRLIRMICAAKRGSQFSTRRLLTSIACEHISDIMDPRIIFARKEDNLDEVIELMLDGNIKEIPIVDQSRRIIANLGILDLWRLAERNWRCECADVKSRN
ncbi:MAG TPA: CBS domain-containing protein [Thermodesulfobacteriaceae bacterium]|nr:CBS domain-containing protein [Thermodesulfobacteriaceae bacterium]